MPSVVSQAISMQRTPEISSVLLGGSFSPTPPGPISNLWQASGTFTSSQTTSNPYQKMVVMTRVSKPFGFVFNNLDLSISGSPGILVGSADNFTNNLYMHFINFTRAGSSLFYAFTLTGTNETSGEVTLTSRVYFLSGGSGPHDIQSGTNTTAHSLDVEDFINNKAVIFAISTGTSITGITTQASSPTTGGEILTLEGNLALNLNTSGLILSSVFK